MMNAVKNRANQQPSWELPGLIKSAILSITVACCGFTLMSATAQESRNSARNTVSQPGVSILSFDVDKIGPILTEMRYIWQERLDPDGAPFILGNADGETIFVITPLACRGPANTDCVGMQLVSVFDGQADAKAVNAFNNRYPFANLGINSNGNAYLNRYDIADYGIARGNVAQIVSTFVALADIYNELNSTASVKVLSSSSATQQSEPAKTMSQQARAASEQNVVDVALISAATASEITPQTVTDARTEEALKALNFVFNDDALPLNRPFGQ